MSNSFRSYSRPSPEVLNFRRGLFFLTFVSLTALGATIYLEIQPRSVHTTLDYVLLPFFLVLFAQIVTGFVLSLFGFIQKLRGGDPFGIMKSLDDPRLESDRKLPSTAVIIPVFNEDMDRVAARIRNMWHSLDEQKSIASFDFYILSDSNDPEFWAAEEEAWIDLVQDLNASGTIFYRKRRKSVNKKSGNIADFCRRWGKLYRYMIVLDADSIMAGKTMVRLARAMEANPSVGLIQSIPNMVLGESLFRRGIQFAMSICSPVFSSGASYWQMNSSNYWGHNAIVRMAPFIKYCALPELPVVDVSKRHILSHDTIEAALMRKAGYDIWMAPEEDGSYEESPPTLTDMLLRDRRWCKGNLQHVWFLFARGFTFSSRSHIWLGLMTYLSSPLWFIFLVLNTWNAWSKEHDYFNITETASRLPPQLFLGFTFLLLFGAKFFGLLNALPRMKSYGGGLRVFINVMVEIVFSVILAPILMLFHSLFVIQILTGREEQWMAQNRSDTGLTWGDCFRTYGWVTALGAAGIAVIGYQFPEYLLWLILILVPWLLAVPFAKIVSSPLLGRKVHEWGLFLTPEETDPPPVLHGLSQVQPLRRISLELHGFSRLLLDPAANALHLTLLRQWRRRERETPRHLVEFMNTVYNEGPDALSKAEQYLLLWDVQAVRTLHRRLWEASYHDLPETWKINFEILAVENEAKQWNAMAA